MEVAGVVGPGVIEGRSVSSATVPSGVQVVISSSRLVVVKSVAIANVSAIEKSLPASVGSGSTSVEIGAPVGIAASETVVAWPLIVVDVNKMVLGIVSLAAAEA